MAILILGALLLTIVVGGLVFWANPHRFTNRVFCILSFVSAAWLYCVYMAMRAGQDLAPESNPIPWLRTAGAVGAFFPYLIWLLMVSIIAREGQIVKAVRRSLPWLGIASALAFLCFTDFFIPSGSTPDNPKRGIGYLLYNIASFALYGIIVFESVRRSRREQGIRRIELQLLTINSALSCIAVIAINAVGAYLDIRALSRLSSFVILGFYLLTAWSITIHRVFDARQVFLSATQRAMLVFVLGSGIYSGWQLLQRHVSPTIALFVSVGAWSTAAFALERKTRDWFQLSHARNTAATRHAALEIARREPDPNKLIGEFEALLRSWCQTNFAALLFDSGEVYVSGEIEFPRNRPGYQALCKQGWSTPESLQRMRPERGLVDLKHFLTEFSLGLVVTAPRSSANPSLLLSLGTKLNQRPFTYPEVQQVQEIAEFMDNILARSRLSMQARQSEQLATIGLIGASLAHEIRNPLVSIKTFSSLLGTRFDDPEFRRRFSVLIPAEVERIDNLTQQLLDLSNPRRHQMERASLHTIVQETCDLMLTRAQDAQVSLVTQLHAQADTIWADANAIRQVVINLLINAFQAMEGQESERQVQIRTRNASNNAVVLEVADTGPGIAPEHRAKLFHPFASTKTKGMGLGLAVCADILHEHRATIIVPDVGRSGATFRITFPCPPPSS